MNLTQMIFLLRGAVMQIFILVAPIVLAALAVGLVVAIIQAATSIQEQTLTFVPKFFVILGMLAMLGAWMFTALGNYTVNLFQMIPLLR
ncbi:MAG: flagellar biosynthetic protein FliQ [Spirochaetaceae bacterium]|jgi:flagellar biosynthetic protein FliQ|nr:flagellar biosynthetic protein FliQ [Spirochaetaceae bacterium]